MSPRPTRGQADRPGSTGGMGLPDTNAEAPTGRLPPHCLNAQPTVLRAPQERPAVTRMRRPLGVARQECRYARGLDSVPAHLVAPPEQTLTGGAIPSQRRVARQTLRCNRAE